MGKINKLSQNTISDFGNFLGVLALQEKKKILKKTNGLVSQILLLTI